MIDYLEQFFVESVEKREEAMVAASKAVSAEETAVKLPISPRTEDVPVEFSTKQIQTVDVFQNTIVQNFESALTTPEQQHGILPISRPDGEWNEEELERRLRRDSRRYDNEFYWY